MSLAGRRIAFIGGGAMAEALAGGLIAGGVSASQIRIAEPLPERCAQLRDRLGVAAGADYADAVRDSDLVVLAVKPGVVPTALACAARGRSRPDEPAVDLDRGRGPAGVPRGGASAQRRGSFERCPTPRSLVGAGATAICGNAQTDASDRSDASSLFESVGIAWEADSEDLLDAVTGLSGSGPGYVFLFLEALIDAGEDAGLPREAAERLATQTVYGAAKLALEDDSSPAQLRERVSSPGGTTLAGLAALDQGGLREILARAVAAATRRSVELGEGS